MYMLSELAVNYVSSSWLTKLTLGSFFPKELVLLVPYGTSKTDFVV